MYFIFIHFKNYSLMSIWLIWTFFNTKQNSQHLIHCDWRKTSRTKKICVISLLCGIRIYINICVYNIYTHLLLFWVSFPYLQNSNYKDNHIYILEIERNGDDIRYGSQKRSYSKVWLSTSQMKWVDGGDIEEWGRGNIQGNKKKINLSWWN
jgi:hypothetical protein